MALPFNDPSQFIEYNGPNGPVAIPSQFAGSFQLPPPPPAPLPTFDPAELAPPPAPMPPDPIGPVPSAFAPPPPPQQPQFVNPDEAAALPAPPPPKPQKQAPLTPQPPPTALGVSMSALDQQKEVAQLKADAESRAAAAEQGIYEQSDAREAELEKKRADARAQEQKERDRARADIKDAVDRHTNYKIDENRRWNDLSTGRKILAGIGVVMAGLGNAMAKKGDSPNRALDFIMQTLQEDTRLQMDERDHLGKSVNAKKDALADLRSQFTDNEAAYEAALGANTKFVANKVRAAAAGAETETAKLNGMEFAAQLDEKAGQLLESAEKTEYSRKIDDRNYALQKSQAGLGWANYKRGIVESDRSHDLRVAELNAAAEAARAAGDVKTAELMDKKAKEERELGIGSGYSKDRIGLAPSPAAAERLRPVVAAGANAARLIDGIKRVRADSGKEWFNTPEARQLKADMGALIISVKNTAGLGALAGPDMELIEKFVGTTDATEADVLDSMITGLDRARGNLIGQVRSELSAANVEGADKWEPPDLSKPPKAAKNEKLVATMKTAPGQSPGLINRLTPYHEAQVKLYGGADTEGGKSYIRRVQGGYDVKQETMVNQLARGAADGATPEQRSLMLGQLRQVATNESTPPGLRALAAEKLKAIEGAAK